MTATYPTDTVPFAKGEAMEFEHRDDLIVVVEEIDVDKLNVDISEGGYQRMINPTHVDRIVAGFDRNLFDPLTVSLRDDGSYWVIDGHHRFEAIIKLGMSTVPCRLVYGLSRMEEAELFVRAATSRKLITPYDRYRAELSQGVPDAVGFRDTCYEAGFLPDVNSAYQPAVIEDDRLYPLRPIDAARRIWAIDHGKTLSTVLSIVKQAWSQTDPKDGVRGAMLIGLARIVSRCHNLDVDKLVTVLQRTSPSLVGGQGASRSRPMNVAASVGVAVVIAELYNKATRKEADKLPVERLMSTHSNRYFLEMQAREEQG